MATNNARLEQYKKFDEMFNLNYLYKKIVTEDEKTFCNNKTSKPEKFQGILVLSNNMIIPLRLNEKSKLRPLCLYKGRIHEITKTIEDYTITFGEKDSIECVIKNFNHLMLYGIEKKYKSHAVGILPKQNKVYIIDYKVF